MLFSCIYLDFTRMRLWIACACVVRLTFDPQYAEISSFTSLKNEVVAVCSLLQEMCPHTNHHTTEVRVLHMSVVNAALARMRCFVQVDRSGKIRNTKI